MSQGYAYPSFTPTCHHDQYPAIDPTQPELRCSGKIVFITGGGQGIGKAIGIAFGQAHAKGVALIGRTEATLHEAAEEIRRASDGHTQTLVMVADVSIHDQVQRAMDATVEHFGANRAPDVLVNNAGAGLGRGTLVDLDIDEFMKSVDLNLRGPLNMYQIFLRACQKDNMSDRPRTVINIPSGAVHLPPLPGGAGYIVPKLAAAKLTEFLHGDRPDWRVFNMQPGVVNTELARKSGRNAPDAPELPAGLAVWLTAHPQAVELNGCLFWANWDVNEMLARKDEIQQKDLLKLRLKGWADDYSANDLLVAAASLAKASTTKKS